jgi:RND family efflux transporter MFP subunit
VTWPNGLQTWLVKGLLPVLVLAGAGGIALYMMRSAPSAERTAPPERRAQLVEIVRAERASHRVRITAWGTVDAAKDVQLRARVGGEVVAVSDSLRPGGRFAKGDEVLRIDPRDYRLDLARARSDLEQARADLKLEQGNQEVAKNEYDLLREQLPNADKSLVLREPQLQTAKARLASAEAAVRQAELDLERTRVRAPFDAKVVSEGADPGTNLSTQDVIARLVGTDRYWVELAIPASKLRWIDSAEDGRKGRSRVVLHNPSVWGPEATRAGFVREILPNLTETGRMARLLVEVPDPLAEAPSRQGKPPLLLGAYLKATVAGQSLKDVVAVNRAHLRQDDTVWVMNEAGELEIRAVKIAYRGEDQVFIAAGVNQGDRIVTSPLPAAAPGMPLRVDGGERQGTGTPPRRKDTRDVG